MRNTTRRGERCAKIILDSNVTITVTPIKNNEKCHQMYPIRSQRQKTERVFLPTRVDEKRFMKYPCNLVLKSRVESKISTFLKHA